MVTPQSPWYDTLLLWNLFRAGYLAAASKDDKPVCVSVYDGTVVTSGYWYIVTSGFLQLPFHILCAQDIQVSSFLPSLGDSTPKQVECVTLLAQRCPRTSPRFVCHVTIIYSWCCGCPRSTWFGSRSMWLASKLTKMTNLHSHFCAGSPFAKTLQYVPTQACIHKQVTQSTCVPIGRSRSRVSASSRASSFFKNARNLERPSSVAC